MSQSPLNQWDDLSSEYCKKVLTPFANRHSTDAFLSLLTFDNIAGCILDAGCGNGYFLESLLAKFPVTQTPVAVDLSEKMVESASRKLGKSVHLIRSNIDKLPLADNSFDCVFAINSVLSEKRMQREHCFNELSRVLCPNRCIVLLLPALESYWGQLHVAREQFVDDGMDEHQAVWEVYNATNERLFDPIGGYINIENSSLRIKLYTQWEIGRFLGSFGFKEITISKYWYSREHCIEAGLFCSESGLFDWYVTARK